MKLGRSILVSLLAALVLASCGSGTGTTGSPSPTSGDPVVPGAPANVAVVAGDGQVEISWDAVATAESYTVYWKNAAGVTSADTAIASATSPYAHTGLTNGTAYYYAVAAANAAGLSALSGELSATPQPPVPGAPQNAGAASTYEKVTVTWDAVAGAASYNLSWSTTAGVTPENGTKIASATSPFAHDDLTGGTAYYYVVTAVNAGGEGAASSQVSATADYPQKRAFVSLAGGQGNLSSWPLANGKAGLDAADEICNASAAAQGIAGTFKAWISDQNNDAYCRIHGGTGKKGACVGATTAIGFAGPWIRMDGLAFADRIDLALEPNRKVYRPVTFFEDGSYENFAGYFANTEADGECSSGQATPCNNWTDSGAGSNSYFGDAYMTGTQWTEAFNTSCNAASHLLCLEAGRGGALPAQPTSGKKVFVTSQTGTGDFSSWPQVTPGNVGLVAADEICQTLATAAGVAGTFKAFLSDSLVHAKDRLTSDEPRVRIDGVRIADNKADLLDNLLDAPINVTETGVYLEGDMWSWTGSGASGWKMVGEYCLNWASALGANNGRAGEVTYVIDKWAEQFALPCNQLLHLYCFEE